MGGGGIGIVMIYWLTLVLMEGYDLTRKDLNSRKEANPKK